MTSEVPDWSLSEATAQQVRRLRLRRDMNREQLAEACQKLGAPGLSASAIANIETGRPDATGRRRRDVTVDELLVLARALRTPPILLLFPVGTQTTIDVLPGVAADTAEAMQWFTGESPGPDVEGWETAAAPVLLWRQHARQVSEYFNARDEVRRWNQLAPSDELDTQLRLQAIRERIEDDLRTTRAEMRRHGLTPPALPDELKQLDGRE